MRATSLRLFTISLVFGAAVAVAAPAAQANEDPLEAFGGSPYPNLYVDSGLADVPATAPEPTLTLLAQATDEDDVNDPLEPMNRVFFEFNQVIYEIVFTPIAKTYNKVFPGTFRLAVSNLIEHLASPVTLANDLLQFEFERAVKTVGRFVVNTVAGMGGIADVAAASGDERHKEDFGQTLAVWGMGEGVYLVLPLLGPSSPRDAVGKYVVDPFFDPLGLWLANTERDAEAYSRMGVNGLDEYASIVDELEQIKKTSVDFYAAIRSLYRQKRQTLISNGREEDLPAIPNYDLNFNESDGVAGVK